MLESITWIRTKMIPNSEMYFHKDLKDRAEVAGVEVEHRDLSLCYSTRFEAPSMDAYRIGTEEQRYDFDTL
jgi:hypothetical protein